MDALSFPKLVLCGLPLCVSVMLPVPAATQPSGADAGLPVLYGVRLGDGRIEVDVASSGCTDGTHFSVRLEPEPPDGHRLMILRDRTDRCRMAAHIVTVTLELPALPSPAGTGILLANRLAVPAGLPRSDP